MVLTSNLLILIMLDGLHMSWECVLGILIHCIAISFLCRQQIEWLAAPPLILGKKNPKSFITQFYSNNALFPFAQIWANQKRHFQKKTKMHYFSRTEAKKWFFQQKINMCWICVFSADMLNHVGSDVRKMCFSAEMLNMLIFWGLWQAKRDQIEAK